MLDKQRLVVEDLRQSGRDGHESIDEGLIWDVSQRFQTVERSSQTAADKLSVEYYKNKVGQCIELCKEQLLDDNIKFSSQSQAEDTFHDHLVRWEGSLGHGERACSTCTGRYLVFLSRVELTLYYNDGESVRVGGIPNFHSNKMRGGSRYISFLWVNLAQEMGKWRLIQVSVNDNPIGSSSCHNWCYISLFVFCICICRNSFTTRSTLKS